MQNCKVAVSSTEGTDEETWLKKVTQWVQLVFQRAEEQQKCPIYQTTLHSAHPDRTDLTRALPVRVLKVTGVIFIYRSQKF